MTTSINEATLHDTRWSSPALRRADPYRSLAPAFGEPVDAFPHTCSTRGERRVDATPAVSA